MLNPTRQLRKKGWTYNPGGMGRGGKNTTWRPKMSTEQLQPFLFLDFEHPRRRPDTWNELEFRRLGMVEWPKQVGFFNGGDNFELTPDMSFRLFQRNHAEPWWTREDNERAIIALLPLVERAPEAQLPRVEEIFRAHVQRFGADHVVYNAAMQAVAFARDLPRCEEMLAEMRALRLEPNAQSFVNLMLAARLALGGADEAAARARASDLFNEGVRCGALQAVVRLDTEFAMWWAQLERMGSFTERRGFLSVDAEGAKPRPRDMWALWGWDRTERKFQGSREEARAAVHRVRRARNLGAVHSGYRREPWHRYKGMTRSDFVGPPQLPRRNSFPGAPRPQAALPSPPAPVDRQATL